MIHLRIKLNLNVLLSHTFSSVDDDFFIYNLTNIENWYSDDPANEFRFEMHDSVSNKFVYIALVGSTMEDEFFNTQILSISTNNLYIICDCDIDVSDYSKLLDWISYGIIEIDIEGKTAFICGRLNDERDAINKKITWFSSIAGTFKAPLGIKRIEVDVEDYAIENVYNYVYFSKLKRYYYITDIQFMNSKFTRLILQEDVLMSWKNLITSQNAFINRYEGATNKHLIDDRYPVEDIPEVTVMTPLSVSGSNCISFKYSMPNLSSGSGEKAPNVLLKTVADILTLGSDSDNITSGQTGLPDIQSRRSPHDHHYLLNLGEYGFIMGASINNDAPSSYIRSILLLPFDLRDIFPDAINKTAKIYSGTKQLLYGNTWGNPTSDPAPTVFETAKGGSPYIKVADFYFNSTYGIVISDNYLDYSPNTLWEIYLPFVGWIQLNAQEIYGKRIQVYYTFDLDTGMSTAFIYLPVNSIVIWSGSCQIGMKLPLAVTNREELARQKQATTLNLIMGMLSSSMAIGIGAYGGNALAVAGGVMSAGKTIASAVNTYNSLIEKAQISYGSSDNALYNPLTIKIRKTKHNKLLVSTVKENVYKHINGYPYKQYESITNLTSGKYIEVGEIHFDAKGYDIYPTEIDEIIALLKEGVIL